MKYFSPIFFVYIGILSFFSCNKTNDIRLIQAARSGNFSEIHNLVESGANINVQDSSGKGILHILCSSYFQEDPGSENSIILYLILHGTNVNLQDQNGNTALFYAIQSGNFNAAKSLVNHGSEVNIKNLNMQTPIFYAVSFIIRGPEDINSINFVKFLYEAGADLNVQDTDQKNLLHISKNPFVTAWLINHGLDFKHRDKFGKTPLDYSSEEIFKARDSIIATTQKRKS